MKTKLSFAFALVLAFFQAAQAQGGPPMLTDDPGTPGDGHWEINFLSTLERSRTGWLFEAPNVDLNYGVGNRIQLKFEAPWLIKKETGARAIGGPGNSMAGIKWRFLDEERSGFDVSTYPQLEFNDPTRSVVTGLTERGMNLFLPIEAVKKIGRVEVDGEIGYRIVQHRTDEWEGGLLVTHRISRRIELMAELHGSALRNMTDSELLFNAGSRLHLGKNSALLFSAGRTIRNAPGEGPHYIAAFGIQINFNRGRLTALRER